MKRLALAITAFLACIAAITPAFGSDSHSQIHPREFGKTLPPIGFVKFCLDNPNECSSRIKAAAPAQMSPDIWGKLDAVNRSVNAAIRPVSDQDLYGVAEYWTYPIDSGDCEDYLLLKKRQLERMGFAPNSLLITVVMDEHNEGHAVLTAVTDKGDYVLDNRRNDLLLWSETGYRFLKRQSQENAKLWIALARQKGEKVEAVSSGE
jgi:predicted transglutaminase-like cysteine proteinase